MKHGFLRRLSALALVLVMAASLCTPAWAEDEGGNTQSKPTPAISTQLIVLEKLEKTQELTVTGLAVGDTITWEMKGVSEPTEKSVTITEASENDGKGGKQTKVTVSLTGTGENAKGTVSVGFQRKLSEGKEDNYSLGTCYIYCREEDHNTVPIQLGMFNTGVAAVAVGGTVTRTVTITDDKEIIGGIKFESGSDSIAKVKEKTSSGDSYTAEIEGVKTGTVTIRVLSAKTGALLSEWELTVTAPSKNPATSLLLSHTRHTMAPTEQTFKLTATVTPKDTTDEITWKSSGEDLATVDKNGLVTRKSAGSGTVIITAYAGTSGKIFDKCTITLETAPSKLELSKTNLTLGYNTVNAPASDKLEATPSGEGVENATTITWTSSNKNVAEVDETGKVTAKAVGTATITAEADFGTAEKPKKLKATCAVIVIDDKSTLVDTITLSGKTDSVPEGGTVALTAAVSPSNASDKTVTWDSSDSSVATVDQKGVVTALKAGETTIYGTAIGGARGTYRLTVTPKAAAIRLSGGFSSSNPTENTYAYTFGSTGNDRFTVRTTLTPAKAADTIRWWVAEGGERVATVPATGSEVVIRAKDPGSTTVYAIPQDHKGEDRKEVTPARITVTVSGITLDSTSLTPEQGRRQELNATAWGTAYSGDHSCEWISSDPAVVTVSSASGASITLTARAPGSAVITARKSGYTATCSVTVTEDTAGVIEGMSTPPGVAYEFSNLTSRLQSACSAKTGASLAYVTNLSVSSTDQGILHDNHYSSDDTGAGVGVQDRYYPGAAPQGQRSLNDLSFVPRTTFSGTAEINYTAWSTNNQSVNGVIRIAVNGTGDVMYSANAGSVVHFQASDFSRIHSNLRSVSFTPPLESAGILYYKYTTSSQPGTRVTASDVYGRTGAPNLDDVSFVPAAGYQGTVKISYKGTDTSGRTITGVVTVNVTNGSGSGASPADISYSVQKESWVTFRPSDFSTACRYAMGESLSYVRFTQPPSGEGALFYNYKGFSDFDGTVASTTSYYYSGTPALSRVSFVPTTTTPSQVDIPYTGYTTRGNTFTGTVHISLGRANPAEQGGVYYTVFTGRSVNFNAGDFNAACLAALGRNLASIQFNSLPGTSQGTLRFTWGNSSTPSSVSTGTRFLRTGSSTSNLIGNVFFQANSSYTGTFTIPFTGTSDNGATFTDVVTIVVTPPASREITYSGTTANPIRLYSSHVVSAAYGALDGTLSYITFNNLPDITAGKLYFNYSGLGTGTQVTTGTRYYISGSPGIDQISFVPRGRCSGQVGVGYTAVNTSGQSVSGRIMFNITSTGNSSFFNDMGSHTWAAPSVDYLYQNGIVKGTTATTFGPGRRIKRCDFVLMLCRAFRFSGSNGYSFADVPINSYYSQAVATAKQLGIISGDGVNFHPNSELTRQDAMVMIYNALNAAGWNVAPASASVLNQFTDSGFVSVYARNAVSALVQLGAVTGSTSGRLNPRSPITRAEAAIILHFIMTM